LYLKFASKQSVPAEKCGGCGGCGGCGAGTGAGSGGGERGEIKKRLMALNQNHLVF